MAPMSQSSIRVRQGALPTSLSALGELPDSPPASPWLYPMLPPQVLVLRLRDSIIKMGEELEKAAESEAREKESTKYYQRRMEEMKADMNELVQRELESSRRRVELVRGCCPMGPFVLPKMHSFRQPSLCRPSSAPCPPAPPRPGLAQLGCSGMGAQGNPGSARLHVLLQNEWCPPSPAPLGGQGAVEVVVPALQGMQSTPSLGYSEWSWGAPGSLQEQRIPAHPLQPQIIEPKLSLQLLAFHFSPAGQAGLGSLSALSILFQEANCFSCSSLANAEQAPRLPQLPSWQSAPGPRHAGNPHHSHSPPLAASSPSCSSCCFSGGELQRGERPAQGSAPRGAQPRCAALHGDSEPTDRQ